MKFKFAVIIVALLTGVGLLVSCTTSEQSRLSEITDITQPSQDQLPAETEQAPDQSEPETQEPATQDPATQDSATQDPATQTVGVDFTCDVSDVQRTVNAREPLPDSSPREDVPSALANPENQIFEPLIDPTVIRFGGPPPEGIPTIDQPCYLPADQVDFLAGTEPVLAVEINGDARAFPLGILTAHELVNGFIGGVPVTVSYCPLCNSGIVYDRRVGTRVLDFGTSGSLYQSSLVMYDRQTQSLWTHIDGQAVVGHLVGEQLDFFPTKITSWEQWRNANPQGAVLSTETGIYSPGSYIRNPYANYDTSGGLLSANFQSEEIDDRLPVKERVIGITSDAGDSVAIIRQDLSDTGVIHFSLMSEAGQQEYVAFSIAGTNSALDTSLIADGRDVGSVTVFLAEADGRQLTFSQNDDMTFVDSSTGTVWNIFGQAIEGELAGERLTPVVFLDTFWFAWSTFTDGTKILSNT